MSKPPTEELEETLEQVKTTTVMTAK
jgi:hypothetical protein